MSELPKCRLCGCAPIRLIDGSVKHDEFASQCSLRLSVLKGEEWTVLMGGGEPVAHQFFDPGTNRWHDFMSDKHRRDTADAGYEIRALYAHPAPAVDDAVLRDAARYRWLRDPCSGAERIITYSRGDYGRGLMSGAMIDSVIDDAMEGG